MLQRVSLLFLLVVISACRTTLESRYDRILAHSAQWGEGGKIVLEVAYTALREGKGPRGLCEREK